MGGLSGCTNESIIYTLLIIALIANAECRSLPSIDEDLRGVSKDQIEEHRTEDSGVSKTLAFGDDNSMLLIKRLRREADANAPKAVTISREQISPEDRQNLEKTTPKGQICLIPRMKAGVKTLCSPQLLVEWSPADSNDLAEIKIYGTLNEIKRQDGNS